MRWFLIVLYCLYGLFPLSVHASAVDITEAQQLILDSISTVIIVGTTALSLFAMAKMLCYIREVLGYGPCGSSGFGTDEQKKAAHASSGGGGGGGGCLPSAIEAVDASSGGSSAVDAPAVAMSAEEAQADRVAYLTEPDYANLDPGDYVPDRDAYDRYFDEHAGEDNVSDSVKAMGDHEIKMPVLGPGWK